MASIDFKTDFKTAVKQEEAYLRILYPTQNDIPTCTNHLDTYFACNGIIYFFLRSFSSNRFRVQPSATL